MSDYARLIEIFERLVAYPTITGDKRAAFECLQYVERSLTIAGLQPTRYSSNGFESLVATTTATKRPKVFLQAHLDVVPASDDMFQLRRDGKKLIGRGAYDMKYAAACFLLLIEELGDKLGTYDFGVMFTTDEECDGSNGVKYLLEQGYGCEVCVLPDGGDKWRLETAAKGGWAVKATVRGKTSHGSRPWEGDNAIDKLLAFIHAANALVPEQARTGTTMVVSQIGGGNVHNQVPDVASAVFDFRFMNHPAGASIRESLSALATAKDIELTNITDIQPIELNVTLPAVEVWEQVVAAVRGRPSDEYALSFGASDARYFAACGIPVIVTRPDGGGHHSADEWIEEAGLYDFHECVKRYIETTARIG
ncbi:MAG TPA: M20/M25/M40 family metallo-hydrolase [Candidatus Saccharimonadales bacterium]|nr:M20/M25/M40 family metallo-hydrolase [Candidatus Saccharimonadales bacterium]